MPFPEEILDIKVEALIDGLWTNITDYVYKESISIERGSADESSYSQPTKCAFLLNNIDGRFSPRNPNSPYYGKIGKNTPILVSVMGGDPFLDLPETGSAYVTGFTTPAEVDVRIDAQLWNWHQEAGRIELASCYTGFDGWIMKFDDGCPMLDYGDGSFIVSVLNFNPFTVPPSGRMTLRMVIDNTAETYTFYQGPSVDGPWTLIHRKAFSSTANPVVGATAPLTIGDRFANENWMNPNGKVFAFQVRDGSDGPILADIDFSQLTPGDTAYTDAQGNDWVIGTGASVNNQYNRFRGEITGWPGRWTTGGFDSWVEMKAESISRRYGQGVDTLRSTMVRTISLRPNAVAYWPMEDPDGTGMNLSALTPSTRLLGLDGDVSLAAHAGPPGSDSLPSFGSDSTWHGEVNTARYPTPGGGWQVQWVANFQQLTTNEQMFMRIQTTGTIREWRMFIDQDTVRITGHQYDADGGLVEVFNKGIGWDFNPPSGGLTPGSQVNQWIKWQLQASQNGPNVEWSIAGVVVGSNIGAVESDSFTGAVGPVNSVMGPPRGLSPDLDGLSVGHIVVYYGTQQSIFDRADTGYPGESALERMRRLTEEQGENFVFLGDYEDTLTMGEQRPDRFLDLLRECAATDRGIFGDTRDIAQFSGFRFVGRASLYNQRPVLVLDYEGDGEVHAPLDPTDDDQYARNLVTVEQERGGRAVAEKAEGVNSTEAPPFGIGPYETTVTVNTDGIAVLPEIAAWEVHLGTWDEERYPTVLLRLQAAPHLIPAALMIDQGTVIRIRNARDADTRTWVPPGDIDLMVRGYNEIINQFQWEIELQCVPARPYNVPVLTSTTAEPSALSHDHVDTDATELVLAMDEDDTVAGVYVYAGPTWTDDVADTPFDLTVGGEQMRVTAPGGIVNANSFFAQDATSWDGVNTAVTWSDEYVHPDPSATGSALVTPDGVNASGDLRSAIMPAGTVKPGGTYVVSGWVYSPAGWSDLRVGAYWYNGPTFLSASTGDLTVVPAGVWTYLEATVTAPTSGVDSARVRIRQGDTPAATDVYYAWGVRFTRATSDWANDTFNRTVASGWAEMDSGDDWVNTGGSASDYGVSSGYGQHLLASVDVSRRSTIPIPGPDFDVYCDVAVSATATGDSLYGGIIGRYTDTDNLYHARAEFTTGGLVHLDIRKRVAGVEVSVAAFTGTRTYAAGTMFRMRFQGYGANLRAKVWPATEFEPTWWHASGTNAELADGDVGVRSIRFTGNTNTNPVVRYDNFRVANPQALAVERSRNNVVKSHSVGDDVRLTYPAITAL